MKNFKLKLVSLSMALVLTVSVCPISKTKVYADSADTSVVRLLRVLGVMDVDQYTGKFWDETPVKRAEVAEIVYKLLKLEGDESGTSKFSDVKQDKKVYVDTIVEQGYMSGYSETEFGSDDYITGYQLTKVFVTLLGGNQMAEALGGYPYGYVSAAKRLGLSLTAISDMGANARRIDVANMIYAAMDADVMQLGGVKDGELVYYKTEGETFLSEVLNIYRIEGVMNKDAVTALNRPDGAGEEQIQIGERVVYDYDNLAADYLGCDVLAYVEIPNEKEQGKLIFIEEDKDNDVISVFDEDIIDADRKTVEYVKDNKSKTIKLSSVPDMLYNGKATNFDAEKMKSINGQVEIIDNNNDGQYDVVKITDYKTRVADSVNPMEEKLHFRFAETSLELEDAEYKIFKDGAEIGLEDIAKDNVLLCAISEDGKVVKINVSDQYAIGAANNVTKQGDKTYVTVSENRYEIGEYAKALITAGKMNEIEAGGTGNYYIDSMGRIAYYTPSGAGDVAYVTAAKALTDEFVPTLTIKIFTAANEFKELTAKNKIKINGVKTDISKLTADSEVMTKLKARPLIKYAANDNELTEIILAKEGYDTKEFSLDSTKTMKYTADYILDNRYNLASDTIIFRVPDSADNSIMGDKGYYTFFKPTWFGIGGNVQMQLYDIDENGHIAYALWKLPFTNTVIDGGTAPFLAVGVDDAIDADGNEIKIIKAYNENGKLVEYKTLNLDVVVDRWPENNPVGAVGATVIEKGDIIQIHTGSHGMVDDVNILHKHNMATYYDDVTVGNISESEKNTKEYESMTFGEVIRSTSSSVLIKAGEATSSMTPFDASRLILSPVTAVYCYDSGAKEKIYPISFSDIEPNDKVFVILSKVNKTKMMVVYR